MGLINNTAVCFAAVAHFPHPKVKNYKRVSRIVVLPDYQGIGIGHNMLNALGELYKRFYESPLIITSSNVAMFHMLKSSARWDFMRLSRAAPLSSTGKQSMQKGLSSMRYTFSFKYEGLK